MRVVINPSLDHNFVYLPQSLSNVLLTRFSNLPLPFILQLKSNRLPFPSIATTLSTAKEPAAPEILINKVSYVSWAGGTGSADAIEIGPHTASCLGFCFPPVGKSAQLGSSALADSAPIYVEVGILPSDRVEVAEMVELEPLSADDWEILVCDHITSRDQSFFCEFLII